VGIPAVGAATEIHLPLGARLLGSHGRLPYKAHLRSGFVRPNDSGLLSSDEYGLAVRYCSQDRGNPKSPGPTSLGGPAPV
jgi:hypothetical protein